MVSKKRQKHPGAALGVKYGFTVRDRYARLLALKKSRHRCPRCETGILRPMSVGVWSCTKCGFTMAGGAYQPITKVGQAALRSVTTIKQ
ncbi:50S ribosomal protein L37ae [Candidatus Bathyarchaeota archaeon ex4484_205]|nr:MAG: 50S ribosomal protein L37ae [Candidatus Bathyarchaeota archaeon ex4484_205]HDN17830.1 50S ribosomal protein L37ae [Candidatus Bathyarchaeota archaeon]